MKAGPGPVLVILGPTATGKSAVATELACQLDGEIISADSRAFFRGLDIITDKPRNGNRRGIPHHLIDCVPIDGEYDAMSFRADVVHLLPEIRARGRLPIIAGGGTLYLGAILRGIFEGSVKNEALRAEFQSRPLDELHDALRQVDPVAARKIHRNDRLRMTRALEVFHSTGRPISEWHADAEPIREPFCIVGLQRERSDHRTAIEARVRRMLTDGVLDEVKALQSSGLSPHVQAYRTIGVPEAFEVLQGTLSEEAFVTVVSSRTWQLAKRQMAWFRRDQGVRWIQMTGKTAAEAARNVMQLWDLRSRRA